MSTTRRKQDIESQHLLTGDKLDNEKRYRFMEMQKQEKFIKRSYWMCLLLFLCSGLVMTIAIFQGMYKDVILAETVMVSVLGTSYLVLFIVMLFCAGDGTLRVAILLFVSCFVGIVGGFMIGVNLKMVVKHLEDGN